MSNIELIIVILLFAANLMLGVIAWCLGAVNLSIKAAQASNVAIATTTHTLMREHQAELQRARLRVR